MYGFGTPPKKYKDTSSTLLDTCYSHSKKIWVVDKLLRDHEEIPHVLDLAVQDFFTLSTSLLEHSFMGLGVGGVPCDSSDSPSPLVLGFGVW